VPGVHQGLGDFALQTWKTDVEASLKEEIPAGSAQVLCFAKIPCAPKNSAIPCRDDCLIQVISSPSNAKNLSGEPERYTLYILRMEELRRFHNATLVRIRQPIVPVVQPSESHMRKDVTSLAFLAFSIPGFMLTSSR